MTGEQLSLVRKEDSETYYKMKSFDLSLIRKCLPRVECVRNELRVLEKIKNESQSPFLSSMYCAFQTDDNHLHLILGAYNKAFSLLLFSS